MHNTRDFFVRMARPAAKASQQVLPFAMSSFAAPAAARSYAAVEASRIHAASLAQRSSAFFAAPQMSPISAQRLAAPVAATLAPVAAPATAVVAASEVAEVVGAFECVSPSLVPAHILASQQASDVAAGVYELCAVPKKRTTIHKRRVRRTGHWQMKLRTLYKPYQTCLGCKQTVAPHFTCANGCQAPRV